MIAKQYSDHWAYDLDIAVIHNGEIYDINVIDQSIETILATTYGERLFNPSFGSGIPLRLFEGMTASQGELLLDDVADALKQYEDRITVRKADMRLKVNMDDNSVIIIIPYTINRTNISSVFKKRIINS